MSPPVSDRQEKARATGPTPDDEEVVAARGRKGDRKASASPRQPSPPDPAPEEVPADEEETVAVADEGGDEAAAEKDPRPITGKHRIPRRGPMKGNSDKDTGEAPKGGKGKKKKGKDDDKALELEPISPFSRGISIGVKFAALTAAVVAFFMILLGYLTYSITVQEVNDQINNGGVAAVSALEKGVDTVFWVEPTAILEAEFPLDAGAAGPAVEETKKQRTHLWEVLKNREQQELNSRFKSLVEQSPNKQIVSAAILERVTGGSPSAIVIYPERFSVSSSPLSTIAGVDVFEGRAQVDGKDIRVRRFDKALLDSEGKPVPPQTQGATVIASVFVSAAKIDDVNDRLYQRIALVTAIGAFAGIILTAVIAAVLSRPIRLLETDISIVAEGNLEHETVPRSRDEIGALAHAFNIMTRNLKAASAHAAERKAIERELAIATEIQTKLLPERIPQIPGLDVHSFYLSAKEVGGDYYDFIVIDQTHLGIIVADVSGKGIPGSMVMTMARSLVRLASVRNVSPADTFKKVNRILAKDIRRGCS